jgi:hypothetical protein
MTYHCQYPPKDPILPGSRLIAARGHAHDSPDIALAVVPFPTTPAPGIMQSARPRAGEHPSRGHAPWR